MMITESWEKVPIGRFVELINGFAFPSEGFTDGEGTPLIRIRNLDNQHTAVNFSGKYDSRYLVKKGDLLIGMDGDFLTVKWKGCDALLNQRVCKLITKDPATLSQDFLFYRVIEEVIRINRITAATTVKHLSSNDVLGIEIELPPTPEQTKIAEILSTVDQAIEQTEALIAKQQRIKTGLMQDLLTRGIDEHGNLRSEQIHKFKDSPLGRIPVEWEVVSLSYFIKRLEAGISVNSDDKPCGSGQIGVLKTSALNKGDFLPDQNKTVLQIEENRVRVSPTANTILISRMNTPDLVGESGFVDKDYSHLFLPDRIWMTIFQDGKEKAARWLSFVMTSPHARSYITLNATGTSGSMKNLPKASLFKMPLRAPTDPEEQQKIAHLLECQNIQIGQMKQSLEKLRSVKTALMQDLLTGRKRVNPLLTEPQGAGA